MSKNGWTVERKKRQSEMIKEWKPWEQSTGPKTDSGKDTSKMNAYKHGLRSEEFRRLINALRQQKNWIEEL